MQTPYVVLEPEIILLMNSITAMKYLIASLLIIASSFARAEEFDHTHQALTDILQQHVEVTGPVSKVDYNDLSRDRTPLDDYLSRLSAISQAEFDRWPRDQQMAFLINAYNGFTLQLIRDNIPVESIKDLGSLFKSPWKKKFFKLFGEDFHLDRIEHEILRAKYTEPRIHFAVNCASIGCPMLLDEAYTADRLEQQLEQQTRLFLMDRSRNRVDPEARILYLSKIFDWFGEDFENSNGSVASFVAPYMTAEDNRALADEISAGKFKIRYLDYDWNLNGTTRVATLK